MGAGQGVSIGGKKLSTIMLSPDKVFNWRLTLAERNKFTQVQAFWYDYQEKILKMVTILRPTIGFPFEFHIILL